ncbi:Phosphorylated carbohydrates phosphatase [Hordeum vulgare]|nr:Phosphorylated carbohydrates phosphatase [Hordeum vulgare]
MSSSSSRLGSDIDCDEELDLRIALEWYKVDTGVRMPPVCTRTPKSEACTARRERQRARERDVTKQSTHGCRGMPVEPDEDERLLSWVHRRALMMADTEARRLRWKNAKALRLAIEQSEREAKEATGKATRVAKLKWE